jgi:uncharacterized protein
MTDANPGRPPRTLPGLDRENRPYWTGGAEGRLLICRCADCRRYIHPPSPTCPACDGQDVSPEPVSGKGKVVTFTINHQAWVPRLPVPFVFAAVELAEQAELYVFANLLEVDPADVRIGAPVEVLFEAHEDVHLPQFRPAQGGDHA